MSEEATKESGEGGRLSTPMEAISSIMTATNTFPMAMGVLHASMRCIYERYVIEGRVEAGEAGGSLM